jgi:hypothetical protein
MGQLLGLRAVVQRVVEQQRLPQLVDSKPNDAQHCAAGHDQCQAASKVSFGADLDHAGRLV